MKKFISLIMLIAFTVFTLFGQSAKAKIDKEFEKINSKIYPVIKVELSDNTQADLELSDDDKPVFKKIVGDLLCFYGVDKGSHFELILQRQLPENIGIEELDKYAHDNLLSFISDKTCIQQTAFGGIGFTCGGEYEAALVTMPEIWDMVFERLGDSVVFAVPAKDMIVFVNAAHQPAIDGLKNLVDKIHDGGDLLLSRQLFTFSRPK
jgi:uncharacterized protein YtpQ (UPF0354 family)